MTSTFATPVIRMLASIQFMACLSWVQDSAQDQKKPDPIDTITYPAAVPIEAVKEGSKLTTLGVFQPGVELFLVEVNGRKIRSTSWGSAHEAKEAVKAAQENAKLHEFLQRPSKDKVVLRFVYRTRGSASEGWKLWLYEFALDGWDAGLVYQFGPRQFGSEKYGEKASTFLMEAADFRRSEFKEVHRESEAELIKAVERAVVQKKERQALIESMMVAADPKHEKYLELKTAVDKIVILAGGNRVDEAGRMAAAALKIDLRGVNWELVETQYSRIVGALLQDHALNEQISAFTADMRKCAESGHLRNLAQQVKRAKELLASKDYLSSRRELSSVLRSDPENTDAKLLMVDLRDAVERLSGDGRAKLRGDALTRAKSAKTEKKYIEVAEAASDAIFLDATDKEANQLLKEARGAAFEQDSMSSTELKRWFGVLGGPGELAGVLVGQTEGAPGTLYQCVGLVTQYVGDFCIVDATGGQGLLWAFEDKAGLKLAEGVSVSCIAVYLEKRKFEKLLGGQRFLPVLRRITIK